eukprot:g481.t1
MAKRYLLFLVTILLSSFASTTQGKDNLPFPLPHLPLPDISVYDPPQPKLSSADDLLRWILRRAWGNKTEPLPASCDRVSKGCQTELLRYNATAALTTAYKSWAKSTKNCTQQSLEPCWNAENRRWAQNGVCDVHCGDKQPASLLDVCKTYDGALCSGSYEVGLDGTAIKFHIPTCIPSVCDNREDTENLSQCMYNAIREQLNDLILPELETQISCVSKDKNLPKYIFIASVSLAGMFAFCFLLSTFQVLCFRYKPETRTGEYSVRLMSLNSDREASSTRLQRSLTALIDPFRKIFSGDPTNRRKRVLERIRQGINFRDKIAKSRNEMRNPLLNDEYESHQMNDKVGQQESETKQKRKKKTKTGNSRNEF